MLQDFFKHKKARTIIRDGRQTRVLNDGNGGASGIFERQGRSAMLSTQPYANRSGRKWGFCRRRRLWLWYVCYVGSTKVPPVQIETASIGDDSVGSRLKNDP
eukprot:scaffold78085_cov57-Attheya_sp.AAC.1